MRTLLTIIVAVSICGCLSSRGSSRRHAIVNDAMVNPPFVSDHCVIAVDGKPVKRVKRPYLTMTPRLVELEPGTHTLTLRSANNSTSESTVTGDFVAGKDYGVKFEHGTLSVVEVDGHGQPSPETEHAKPPNQAVNGSRR